MFDPRLDLSENCIDAEMSGVMHGIARNKSIVSLNVSKNMTGIKPKYLPNVMEAIVQLLQVTKKQKNDRRVINANHVNFVFVWMPITRIRWWRFKNLCLSLNKTTGRS